MSVKKVSISSFEYRKLKVIAELADLLARHVFYERSGGIVLEAQVYHAANFIRNGDRRGTILRADDISRGMYKTLARTNYNLNEEK